MLLPERRAERDLLVQRHHFLYEFETLHVGRTQQCALSYQSKGNENNLIAKLMYKKIWRRNSNVNYKSK